MDNAMLNLQIERPRHLRLTRARNHEPADFPHFLKPNLLYRNDTIVIHLIAEYEIGNIKHPRFLDNFLLIHLEIGYIKPGIGLVVKGFNFKKIMPPSLRIQEKVGWHLRIVIRSKGNIIMSKITFNPLLHNTAYHIFLPDNDAYRTKIKSNPPFLSKYLLIVKKPRVKFFRRNLHIN